MSTIEKLANDHSLNQLFSDYLTCTIYLDRCRSGQSKISEGVRASLAKRLSQITDAMLKAVRKQNHMKSPTRETVHRAALHIMDMHPAGADYYLRRLTVR